MIGVFDSGFGGLAVLKDIVRTLPQYSYMYLGDTARAPYGNRPMKTIHRFTKQGVEYLFDHGCSLVVVACNTASAEALRKLQQEYIRTRPDKKVLGVIIPAAEEAVEKTTQNRIGVIATTGTVRSGTFIRELKKLAPQAKVFQHACPLLVPLVETGAHDSLRSDALLRRYLRPLQKKNIDTLILGCTHYGHLEKSIRRIVGDDIILISEGEVVARKLAEYLARHTEVTSRLSRKPKLIFYTTDPTDRFKKLGSRFFGKPFTPKLARLG